MGNGDPHGREVLHRGEGLDGAIEDIVSEVFSGNLTQAPGKEAQKSSSASAAAAAVAGLACTSVDDRVQ